MGPFIAAAIPALMQFAPELVRLFGKGEQSEKNAVLVEKVVEIAKAVTGEHTAEGAVRAIEESPDMAINFRQAVASGWFELTEVGGGIEAARSADLKAQAQGNPWRSPALLISGVLRALTWRVVEIVLADMSLPIDVKVVVITACVGSIAVVGGFWLGSSASSQRKDDTPHKG